MPFSSAVAFLCFAGDGHPIGYGMGVIISSEQAWDSHITSIDPNGRFEFSGLPTVNMTRVPQCEDIGR